MAGNLVCLILNMGSAAIEHNWLEQFPHVQNSITKSSFSGINGFSIELHDFDFSERYVIRFNHYLLNY